MQDKIAWVKPREFPVRENSERPNGKCMKVYSYQEDANFQCVGAQQLVERRRKICVGEECIFPFHSEVNYGWSVRGGMD